MEEQPKVPRNGFTDGVSRAEFRKAIEQQTFGRFENKETDDPMPHVWWRMLDDIEELRACLLLVAHARDGLGRQLIETLPEHEAARVHAILEGTK